MAPKVTVYMQDDLHAGAKEAGLNISALTQAAVRAELKKQEVPVRPSELPAVVARLRGTQSEEARREEERWRGLGAKWAKERATVDELEELVEVNRDEWFEMQVPPDYTLIDFLVEEADWDEPGGNVETVKIERTAEIDDFVRGALEVWRQAQPLL